MSWRDRSGPGSFRGVPFRVDTDELSGGRKAVIHEYPLRNEQFVEDLGRRGRSFRVDAYVIGDDYIEQRDRLISALEKEGVGELVLPYLDIGTKRVVATDFSVRESREEGGIALFQMTFEESPELAFLPESLKDIVGDLDASAFASMTEFSTDFLDNYDIVDQPPFTRRSLSGLVSSAGGALRNALAPVFGAIATVAGGVERVGTAVGSVVAVVDEAAELAASIKRKVDSLILDADMIVRDPFVSADRFRDVFESIFQSPDLPSRKIDALLEAYDFVPSSPKPEPITSHRTQEATNYDALQQMIQRMALTTAARFAVRVEYESYEQAIETRDLILEKLDEQIDVADDKAYAAIVDLRGALVDAVPGDSSNLARILTFTPPATLPSLVIAHRLYGATRIEERDQDLVSRNGVRHPGFVLGGRPLNALSDTDA